MWDRYGGAVILIDEIDAVGSRRVVSERSSPTGRPPSDRFVMGAGMGGGAGLGVIDELLVQMDGFTVPRGHLPLLPRCLSRSVRAEATARARPTLNPHRDPTSAEVGGARSPRR
jgi:SpoVK/Ycf46/Vps4 family AAA+-type ATPase